MFHGFIGCISEHIYEGHESAMKVPGLETPFYGVNLTIALFSPLFSYISATEAYKHAIRTNCYASLSSCAWIRASALYRAGHFQQARKALEPALRLSVGTPTTKVEKLYSDILRRSVSFSYTRVNSWTVVHEGYSSMTGHFRASYSADCAPSKNTRNIASSAKPTCGSTGIRTHILKS